MGLNLKTLLLGRTTTTCGFCGATVPDGEGFRPLPVQVYCSEEHAVEDQQSPAM